MTIAEAGRRRAGATRVFPARTTLFAPAWVVERAVAHADRTKVAQILLNLLSNAAKFTPSGGRVTIECALVDERVTLTVADTGPGVPPEQRAAVFEPFVQLGRSLTSGHEGSGLGLAISRDLARAMHGDLTLGDSAGGGAIFTLALPRA